MQQAGEGEEEAAELEKRVDARLREKRHAQVEDATDR